MRAVDIIAKKRDGQALTDNEIKWFVESYTRGDLPDYQASALLMAICIRGMSSQEVTTLTLAMAESGDTLDLSDIADYIVDKHSSGGVGDKTSLLVLPLVASCGVPVAKMSGRGLGFSGGTLDKLESIAGYNVNLTEDQFRNQAKSIGLALSGQSKDLAPADGKLYALRDVTGTVPSLPLIASSIMSKKLASGSNGIVLDVKVGSGAFMNDLEGARDLARIMVDIGTNVGRDVVALISDMNQPLGHAVGNSIEVAEAIEALNGGGPNDFRKHCLEVAARMLKFAGRGDNWTDLDDAKRYLSDQIDSGSALAKFKEMIVFQGGDVSMVDDPSRLPQAEFEETINAVQSGYVAQAAADKIAWAAFNLGAGREKKGDAIDYAVGVKVLVKVGDKVNQDDPVAILYANDSAKMPTSRDKILEAITYHNSPVDPLPLIYDVIERR
jgi:pyrimidine-nucleoside phosphorylase